MAKNDTPTVKKACRVHGCGNRRIDGHPNCARHANRETQENQ